LAGKSWVHNNRAKRTALPKAVAEVEDRSDILVARVRVRPLCRLCQESETNLQNPLSI
jgi:hypothetical protein